MVSSTSTLMGGCVDMTPSMQRLSLLIISPLTSETPVSESSSVHAVSGKDLLQLSSGAKQLYKS